MQTPPNPTPQSDAFRSALYAPAHSPPGRERVLLSVPRLMPLSAIRRCLRKFTARYAARFYPSFRMGVFYRVESKRVVVLAVLHTARDPRVWPQPLGSAR